MQFVYVLVNEHVPDLVKFGYSTRDPHERAAELSAPTGVPGRWHVVHYWEVVDGLRVEQEVFRVLARHRLGTQEFFRLSSAQAVREITAAIRVVGIDPVAKEKAKAAARRRETEDRERATKQRHLRYERILGEIEVASSEVRRKVEEKSRDIQIMLSIGIAVAAFMSAADKNLFLAFIGAAAAPLFAFPFTAAISVFFNRTPDLDDRLRDIRKQVLTKNGINSQEEFEELGRGR